MADGNVWSMVDLDSVKPKLKRSSSFTFRKKSSAVVPPLAKLSCADGALSRVRAGSLTSLAEDESPTPSRADRAPARRWRVGSFSKKGLRLLKKAGAKAGEIFDAQPSVDSESSADAANEDDSQPSDDFFDAVSEIVPSSSDCSSLPAAPPPATADGAGQLLPLSPKISCETQRHVAAVKKDEAAAEAPEGAEPQFMLVLDPDCPIHGRRRWRTASSKVAVDETNASLFSRRRGFSSDEFDDEVMGDDMAILSSQAFAAKLARKRQRATISGNERLRVDKEKFKIKWNLFMISIAFLFLSTAFQGLQNLQTTVNSENGLGAISLSAVYLGLAVSVLFLPPYFLNRLGCKQTMLVAMAMYAVYIVAHFDPRWHSLLPASLLLGVATSCLWAAQCTYLTITGVRYALLNVESPSVVIVRFLGIFFMIVHLGQVFGNLISAAILESVLGDGARVGDRFEQTCGHYFAVDVALSPEAERNLRRPPQRAYAAVCGTYICCTLVAMLIVAVFLNPLRRDEQAQAQGPHFRLDVWRITWRTLRQPRPLLLVPLTVFNGMEQAFIAAEFTKAFVGCCLGTAHIGLVMTAFGVADAVCSLVFGPLIKLFGRMPLFMFGAVVDMLMIYTLLIWPPNPADTAIFYVVAAAWGMADGVWNTQINGFWVALLGQNLEVAFANYRLWESVGFTIALLYTPYTNTDTKLLILLGVLFAGMIGYGLIELWDSLASFVEQLRDSVSELWRRRREKKDQRKLLHPEPMRCPPATIEVSLHI